MLWREIFAYRIDCCQDLLLHISLIVAQMLWRRHSVASAVTRATVAPCFRSLWCARGETRWPWRRCTVRCTCSSRHARVSVAPGSPSSRRARNASTSSLASHSRWSSHSSTSPTGPPTSSARTRTRAKRARLDGPHFLLFFIQLPHEWTPLCFPISSLPLDLLFESPWDVFVNNTGSLESRCVYRYKVRS